MGNRIIFDIETDGLYWNVSKMHCLAMRVLGEDHGRIYSSTPVGGEAGSIGDALQVLSEADEIIGHNIIGYDLPVLKKLTGFEYKGKVTDTLLLSKLLFPLIKNRDAIYVKRKQFPAKLMGRHSLKAWGYRLGVLKGSFSEETTWQEYNAEMRDYCHQDVEVTLQLYNRLTQEDLSEDAVDLEMSVAKIITQQEINGWPFNLKKARELHLQWLEDRDRMDRELTQNIPPFIDRAWFTPKMNNASRGYVAGVPIEKVTEIPFNPNSRQHIVRLFREKYGWKPEVMTDKGQPAIDEEVLKTLPYPEAAPLAERFELQKHIGMLAEGAKAWIKLYNSDTGCLHGSIDTLGTRTRRGAHRDPNLGQVPAHSKYGMDCRSLFYAPEGYLEIGIDAAALELRCLAHYLFPYDNGRFAEAVLYGTKEAGTDPHSINAKACGIDRDTAKRAIYGTIYGAGDKKLGEIGNEGLGFPDDKLLKIGRARRNALVSAIVGLGPLTDRTKALTKERGYLYALDKQKLISPSEHAALNTLLQSAGAILVKRAILIAHDNLNRLKLPIWQTGWVHDEIALLVPQELAEGYREPLLAAFVSAGEYYNFRCPIEGEVKIGKNWAETH